MGIITVFLLLLGTEGWCGAGYDACLREEQRLRADEAERCSSVGYIFNPSACFNARKALTPYTRGKCRALAATEGVGEQKTAPVKPVPVTPSPVTPAAQPAGAAAATAEIPVQPTSQAVPVKVVAQPTELELLKAEVADLKAKLERLQAEVDRLRGTK